MEDYYDPLAVSAIGGIVISSLNNPNSRLGLYSPVNISQHATSPGSAANIASEGFKAGKPGWAGANKIYSSPSADVYKHYGTSKIGMVTPEGNRLPWGGGISKHGVNLSTAGESAMGIEKANKAREFYNRLTSGRYANSPAAQRLLATGKNYAGGLGNFLSKFRGAGNILGKVGMYPVLADVFAGPTDEGFRTTKAYVEPIKKLGNVIKNITTGGGNQDSSTPSPKQERPRRQKGTQKQEQKRQQRTRSRAAQRGQPSKRQQRSRSRSSQRRSRFARRAQGGIVSINDMIGSL